MSDFRADIGFFGYSDDINDHTRYSALDKSSFDSTEYPHDPDFSEVDISLLDLLTDLQTAVWVPPLDYSVSTCLVFISGAQTSDYDGKSLLSTYKSFENVIGVTIGDATTIPGATNTINAPGMTDADVTTIAQKVLGNIDTISTKQVPISTKSVPIMKTITCLFVYDAFSFGENITRYSQNLNFAKAIGDQLYSMSNFQAAIDYFGYSDDINDHSTYSALDEFSFDRNDFPHDPDFSEVDISLPDLLTSLQTAMWVPPLDDSISTCLVFISGAQASDYDGKELLSKYKSFENVIGVTIGDATTIPGATNTINAPGMTDADVTTIAQKILGNIDTISTKQVPISTKSVPIMKTITCLFVYDAFSFGVNVTRYSQNLNFSKTIGDQLYSMSDFRAAIDYFGYSADINDHSVYFALDKDSFDRTEYPHDPDFSEVDISLPDLLTSLQTAIWVPPLDDSISTCLVFISGAQTSDYDGKSLLSSYTSFKNVIGVTIGDATTIPGSINAINAPGMSDADAAKIAQKIIEIS